MIIYDFVHCQILFLGVLLLCMYICMTFLDSALDVVCLSHTHILQVAEQTTDIADPDMQGEGSWDLWQMHSAIEVNVMRCDE